jgi:DNA polymerase-1
MEHSTDYTGMMKGLQYFKNFDDTMILAYLAKNATTKVSLKLKEVALEYVGNYAIEIQDITKYTKAEILKYNLIDSLATFYLWEKYHKETLSRPYLEIFQPSLYTLIKMMLIGLPLDVDRVHEVDNILTAKEKVLREQIQENDYVREFNIQLQKDTCIKTNAKLKKLVKPLNDFLDIKFNPTSHLQLVNLLFETLKLPVLDKTKSGAPATGGDVLQDLKNHTQDEEILDLLKFIKELSEVTKINGTFIKAFMQEKDFLHGNLKLGGTQSGRLASNSPNLTNLPAHGPMGKLVKSCISAPEGWLFAGADFSALEERIGAILSQDPNRIKVYTDGMDGHSMRTHKYFSDQMPDITAALNKAETATKFWINDKGEYCCG